MVVVFDVEANALRNPDKIWVIVCKDVECNEYYIFRNVTHDPLEKERFNAFAPQVKLWIGHNILGYDLPVLDALLGFRAGQCLDTYIISKLYDYSRPDGHSIESYGEEFSFQKGKVNDFKNYSEDLVVYCQRDVDICHMVYRNYRSFIDNPLYARSISTEHRFQLLVNSLENNGFSYNKKKAEKLLEQVKEELNELDLEIQRAFPPRLKPVREVHPRLTQYGTLNRSDFRFLKGGDLSEYNGGSFTRCSWVPFNAASHKQLIDVLSAAGWLPVDKTKTHRDTERLVTKLKYNPHRTPELDLALEECYSKLKNLEKYGWTVNENNLSTLPSSAPSPARTLAKRILLESRRRSLVEQLGYVQEDNRIHGEFFGIGAWTHRMAHQKPNTANIPSEFREDGSPKLLGKEMRSLWQAPRNRLLVGVDAEGIQLRIFAHYIDDEEFTHALVKGRKSDRSDPHSVNQRVLGDKCKSRQAAKRFIYALLLGAGIGKLSQILSCSELEAKEALDRLIQRYRGFKVLKEDSIPHDAQRGYFLGLDGRRVKIPGDTVGQRKHLCMSGYLQNGEAVIMKMAALYWNDQLREEGIPYLFVNMVHDEWQTECRNSMDIATRIAQVQADSLRIVGENLKLKCPLAGSYWSEDHNDYTIGTNWLQTH